MCKRRMHVGIYIYIPFALVGKGIVWRIYIYIYIYIQVVNFGKPGEVFINVQVICS